LARAASLVAVAALATTVVAISSGRANAAPAGASAAPRGAAAAPNAAPARPGVATAGTGTAAARGDAPAEAAPLPASGVHGRPSIPDVVGPARWSQPLVASGHLGERAGSDGPGAFTSRASGQRLLSPSNGEIATGTPVSPNPA
jgi:hypothetical protein